MALVARVGVVGTGWTGAPGFAAYYFDPGESMTDADADVIAGGVQAAYNSISARFAGGVVWTVQPEVITLQAATGVQVGSHMASGVSPAVSGTDTGKQLSRATMVKLRLATGVFINGRHLRGGAFIGPIGSATLTGDGQVEPTNGGLIATAFRTALTTLSIPGAVWHRPVGGAGGAAHAVTSVSYSPVPATLRSRRD